MKRLALLFSVLLFPMLAAHLVLAAGLFKAGEKAPAIANYEKSLQLNPENHGGEAALTQLRAAK